MKYSHWPGQSPATPRYPSLVYRRRWFAEGDSVVYNGTKLYLMQGVYQMQNAGHVFKMTLHTGYTPDIDTHDIWADTGVSSTEYGTASGYTAGGKTLANQSTTQDNTNDRALWDFDDVTWTALGALTPATPSHAIIWDDTPTSPADPLVCYIVLGTTATNAGDYTVAPSASPAAMISLT